MRIVYFPVKVPDRWGARAFGPDELEQALKEARQGQEIVRTAQEVANEILDFSQDAPGAQVHSPTDATWVEFGTAEGQAMTDPEWTCPGHEDPVTGQHVPCGLPQGDPGPKPNVVIRNKRGDVLEQHVRQVFDGAMTLQHNIGR